MSAAEVKARGQRITQHSSGGTTAKAGSKRALGCRRFGKLWFDLSSNHTPLPGAKLRQGDMLCRSGSVVS